MRLILASASPRRSELLRAAGFTFDVRAATLDEAIRAGEAPEAYVRRLAEAKAHAVGRLAPECATLAADTVVLAEGRMLGKPADPADAARMLRLLSGRTHEVLTGVCLLPGGGPAVTELEVTAVEFAPLSEQEIAWYVGTGEPLDKAGAYAIQGLASRFVTRIAGSYSNVVGLPVALVYRMCRDAGILLS